MKRDKSERFVTSKEQRSSWVTLSAIQRADLLAREIGITTGTAIIIQRNQKMTPLTAEELRKEVGKPKLM